MNFLPFKKMWERVELARADSDTAFFHDLLYLGELVIKATVAGLIAGIEDDVDRHRYRHVYQLVRADGLGEWNVVLEQVVAGPAANHLLREATPFSRSLTEKLGTSTWQHACAVAVDSCLQKLMPGRGALPSKVGGRRWIADFVELRNKTRGHGAPTAAQASEFAPNLEKALQLFCTEFPLFNASWAFLHQNLSGKYRISPIGGDPTAFKPLSSKPSASIPDGVYLFFDRPRSVELFHSDPDLLDYFFPNGAFDGKRYELFSYITNTTRYVDASPYLAPAQPLPPRAAIIDSANSYLGSTECYSSVHCRSVGVFPP